jgi:hypothetical protein
MSKLQDYTQVLKGKPEWETYLMAESGLPGPRGNLELAAAVAECGDKAFAERYLSYDPITAPENTPQVYLLFCALGVMGRLVTESHSEYFATLRQFASDPRWRVREGVAIALQRVGRWNMAVLLAEMNKWKGGNWLEKRAVAAALAEPDLLKETKNVHTILQLLDSITASLFPAPEHDDDFMVLRQGLGYCWSVVAVALPQEGKPLMEKWFANPDKHIRWIMKENLKKNRLVKMDAAWVAHWNQQLSS